MQDLKITLHHLPNSRSQRIVWLLEELDLNYELIICPNKIQSGLKFPTLLIQQPYADIHTLTESSAIAEYLCQLNKQFILDAPDNMYWNYCFYKNYADASFMPNLALKQVFAQIAQQTPWLLRFVSLAFKAAFNSAYLTPEITKQLQMLDSHLKNHIWLAGNQFSCADILVWFPLQASQSALLNFTAYPALARYLTQIQSRPAFQTALLKGHWSTEEFQRYWQITQ